jgi:hypothetical protein
VQADEQGRYAPEGSSLSTGLDATLAVGTVAAALARLAVIRSASTAAVGMVQLVRRLPGVTWRHALMTDLVERGEHIKDRLEHKTAETFRLLLRRAVDAALTAIDLTELVRVHVDLDALATGIDVDAVVARADIAAVVARLDLDAIVDRIDIDAIAATIDLDAIVDRIDIDAIVARVDIDAVIARVDVDAIAATIDLDTVVARVDLDRAAARLDLDAILQRVEPDGLVEKVDVEAVVARLDLTALTRQVIAAIDLPVVLRESTGSVSSQAARVVRTEGMHADETVSRWVDRVLHRPHPGAVSP